MATAGLIKSVIFAAVLAVVAGYDYSVYDLDQLCGGGLIFSNMGALIVRLNDRHGDGRPFNCTVTFSTENNRRVMAKVKDMDMESSYLCQESKLSLYSGPVRPENRLTGSASLCGRPLHPQEETYSTSSETLTMVYYNRGTYYRGESFHIVLTDFDDPWEDGDFICSDGRGIDSYLQCDGWENCRYGKDERYGCSHGWPRWITNPWMIAACTVGGVLALGLCLAILTVSLRKASRRRSYTQIKS